MLKIRKVFEYGNSIFDRNSKESSEILVGAKSEYGEFFVYITSYYVPINETMISEDGVISNIDGMVYSSVWISPYDETETKFRINSYNLRLPFSSIIKNVVREGETLYIKNNLELISRFAIEKYIEQEFESAFYNEPTEEDLNVMFDYYCNEYAV